MPSRSFAPVRRVASGRRAALLRLSGIWTAGAVLCAAALGGAHAEVRGLPDFSELVEKTAPAVVRIRSVRDADEAKATPRRNLPLAPDRDAKARHEGSGFIISADGHVVTSAHVVSGVTQILVTLPDKREFKATLVGADERSDVALLKIAANALPVLAIGDPARLRVGEWVMAIGSPYGFDGTVTAGVVSAKKRDLGSDVLMLQSDVSTNPGSAGGPLLNLRGEVVGINSQIYTQSGSHAGLSFAIPIDEAMRTVDALKATGRVSRGYLGVLTAEVPRDKSEEYGLTKADIGGAFIQQTTPGGPADRAGLRAGDVVTALNGKTLEGPADLRRSIAQLRPGAVAVLRFHRRGKASEVKVTLQEAPAPIDAGQGGARGDATEPKAVTPARTWGLTVGAVTDVDKSALRGKRGVKVTAVSGVAEAIGLRPGDFLLSVGDTEVSDVAQFDAALARADAKRSLPVVYLRGDWAQFTRIPAPK